MDRKRPIPGRTSARDLMRVTEDSRQNLLRIGWRMIRMNPAGPRFISGLFQIPLRNSGFPHAEALFPPGARTVASCFTYRLKINYCPSTSKLKTIQLRRPLRRNYLLSLAAEIFMKLQKTAGDSWSGVPSKTSHR